jgi:hypothetical protein
MIAKNKLEEQSKLSYPNVLIVSTKFRPADFQKKGDVGAKES